MTTPPDIDAIIERAGRAMSEISFAEDVDRVRELMGAYHDHVGSMSGQEATSLLAGLFSDAIFAERERYGWQPIETAPKNGTRFLGFEKGTVYAAIWSSGWKCFQSRPGFYTVRPSHWKPLPAAPSPSEPTITEASE